jgi:hypothetical protein
LRADRTTHGITDETSRSFLGIVDEGGSFASQIKRQRIVDRIADMLLTISKANGYNTDAGNNLEIWKYDNYSASELMGLEFDDIDENEKIDIPKTNAYENQLTITISTYFSGDPLPEQGRKIIEDIHKAIGTDPRCNGLALWVIPGRNRIDIERKFQAIGRVRVTIVTVYLN